MRKTGSLESVDNALQVLLLLTDHEQVRVSDVAARLDIGLATAHRLLSTLRARGFVEQRPDRGYARGPALATLAGPPVAGVSLEQVALPHLQRLRDSLDETVHLAVPDGRHLLFVASVESGQSLRVGSRVGARLPMHLTSGGKALLAALPPDELRDRLHGDGPDAVKLTPQDEGRLGRELEMVRRRGYGLNRGGTERGIAAVGVGIFGPDRRPLGVLTVSVPTARLNPARVREMGGLLIRARAALEAELAGGAGHTISA